MLNATWRLFYKSSYYLNGLLKVLTTEKFIHSKESYYLIDILKYNRVKIFLAFLRHIYRDLNKH